MSFLSEIHVVGAAIVDDERCLITRRAGHVSNPGLWEFPGGKIEAGESPESALVREIREELALNVRPTAFLGRGEARLGDRRIVLDVYLAELLGGEPTLTDHDEARWVSAAEVGLFDWAAADVPVLPALKRFLEDRS